MIPGSFDFTTTLFVLPPDAKLLPVSGLSPRLQAKIGYVEDDQFVVTRPGFRITTRLLPRPLAELIKEFHTPSLLTDAILRFSQTHGQNPMAMLDMAFDALATLVEIRILVPHDSPDTQSPEPGFGAGQEFAGYEIEALVRSLEDTEIYRARQTDGTLIALKISQANRPAIFGLFEKEAKILNRLRGIDSPRLLEHGIQQERAFIAMEWCDGVSIAIAAQRARAARDWRRLHGIVAKMLQAYARLHAGGILHGDIHTGNCLAGDDGRIVILDFGNACLLDRATDATDPLRTGIPQFYDPQMASALLDGRIPPAASPASEQYAISVMTYLLLTGLHPIETPAVQGELLRNIAERPPLPFASRGVAAWPPVETVINRGLAKQPEQRFPAVAELAQAFAAADWKRRMPRRWPDATGSLLEAKLEETRNLQPSKELPLHRAWFALRAAVTLEDTELLAAADVLIGQTESGWLTPAVAARIARARSDTVAERQAIEKFVAAAGLLTDESAVLTAILAAATMISGSSFRHIDVTPLADWASRSLESFQTAAGSRKTVDDSTEPLRLMAILALIQCGAAAIPTDLTARLEAFGKAQKGHIWLWSLAHDVLAQPHYKARALLAKKPKDPVLRVFALLRMHQLTGDMRWVRDARRLTAKYAKDGLLEKHLALLLIEQAAPHNAILPPFLQSPAYAL
ncbi:AarF/UbiB family protein [Nitrosomonas sp. sh817]|uniref:protein kinase domain-containing protein n=1 Tax=Nitrosomonas sp. sh817 TaxID=3070658 RepID=UPI0027DAE86D|nr:AarF/UbiB family protein [Nitrosomonas sp. sh817]WMJ07803.1 AarF/UbiB family protein [Nitrosomonas sp. sh817]